nr:collagen EMF1-alpha-like [Labrus bergylta]
MSSQRLKSKQKPKQGQRNEKRPQTRSSPKPGQKNVTRPRRTPSQEQSEGQQQRTRRWSEGYEGGESFSWPQGTKDDPATTCHELGLIHPHLSDGYYYMDPNQGCPYDAVKVFCNFTAGGTTCIDPSKSQIKFSWEPERKSSETSVQWFSQQHGGTRLEYTGLGVVQLRFLRLHSQKSSQRMTISCTGNPLRLS